MTERRFEQTLRVPEPELRPEDMIARAAALRPRLLEEQEEADRRGFYSADIHQCLLDAGIYRCLQPRRFGGYEFDVPTFFKVIVEISRGGPGSGWCACLASGHALIAGAHWSEEGQKLLFGPDGDFRAPHRAAPGGSATPVEGGYLVSGRWRFSSGIPYATHFIGTTLVPGAREEDPPRPIVIAVPRGQYTMLDDWGGGETLGLQASGSNTVVLEDCFVPDVMATGNFNFMTLGDLPEGTPGTHLHGNPMYLGRVAGFYHGELVSVQVGAALAALDEYEQQLHTVRTRFPAQGLRIESQDHQRVFGLAMGMAEAAEAILIRVGELYMEYCRRWAHEGRPFTTSDDLRLWARLQQAGRLCWEAVELLYRSADASIVGRGTTRLQRYFRDLCMYRGHGSAQFETFAPIFSRAYLGLPVGLWAGG